MPQNRHATVLAQIITTCRSTGAVHTSAKARLTSIAISFTIIGWRGCLSWAGDATFDVVVAMAMPVSALSVAQCSRLIPFPYLPIVTNPKTIPVSIR